MAQSRELAQETAAMQTMERVLSALPEPARRRVIAWTIDVYSAGGQAAENGQAPVAGEDA